MGAIARFPRMLELVCATNLHRRGPLPLLLSLTFRLSRFTGRLVAVRVWCGRCWSSSSASGDAAVCSDSRSRWRRCCCLGVREGGIGILVAVVFNSFGFAVLVGCLLGLMCIVLRYGFRVGVED